MNEQGHPKFLLHAARKMRAVVAWLAADPLDKAPVFYYPPACAECGATLRCFYCETSAEYKAEYEDEIHN